MSSTTALMKYSRELLAVLVLLSASACTNETIDVPIDNGERTGCPPAANVGVPQLSDAEIAQVLLVVNTGEIQQGQLAQQRATREEVRRFADRMVTEHTAANQRLQARLQAAGITPADSPLSQQLEAETNQTLELLRTHEGEDFDRAYMDMQVAMHAKTGFLADAVLQPRLQNPELRAEARMERAAAQQHLEDAVPIQSSLAPNP